MPIRRKTKDEQKLLTAYLCVAAILVFLLPWPFIWSALRVTAAARHADEPLTGKAAESAGILWAQEAEADRSAPPVLAARDSSANYPGSSPWRMHGVLGTRADGKPRFRYGPDPGPITDKVADLKEHGFYVKLSDFISLDRNVTSNRHRECRALPTDDYDTLPQTSVIFVFYNEAMSTLLRSIHSVLNRSPPELLKEIILIDDGSDKPHLGDPLEDYIQHLPKVRLVRQPKRGGLVLARLKGAEVATAETFTVLDSHIEVQEGWLPPLMRRMKGHPERIMMPMIDSTNPQTFQLGSGGIGCSLGFLWSLVEHAIDTQPKDRPQNPTDPIRSPAMAGGLFTCNRAFFWKLGGYDTDFSFWGTENLEFSFRLWQCGGTLECSPCSRVYHIFRNHHPYTLPANSVTKNKLRTAAIWMDEYGEIVRTALGNPKVDIGPLDHMIELRKRLECKPFSWYMQNVYPTNVFAEMSTIAALGEVRNVETNQCLDSLYHDRVAQSFGLYGCHGQGGTQAFALLGATKDLRPIGNLDVCLLPTLRLGSCSEDKAKWDFTSEGYLLNEESNHCLAVSRDGGRNQLKMVGCGSENTASLVWKLNQRESPRLFGAKVDHPAETAGPTPAPNASTVAAAKTAALAKRLRKKKLARPGRKKRIARKPREASKSQQ